MNTIKPVCAVNLVKAWPHRARFAMRIWVAMCCSFTFFVCGHTNANSHLYCRAQKSGAISHRAPCGQGSTSPRQVCVAGSGQRKLYAVDPLFWLDPPGQTLSLGLIPHTNLEPTHSNSDNPHYIIPKGCPSGLQRGLKHSEGYGVTLELDNLA